MLNKFSLYLILILSLPAFALGGETLPAENLPTLIETAVRENPELQASEARWRMFRSKIGQAGALEDPMVMLRIQNALIKRPLSFDKDPMTAKVIGISQQLPFFGKRPLREEIAEKEAETYRWSLEERKLELIRMVKENYYRLYAIDREREVVENNLALMETFISMAEIKYSVGQGVQQDIFKAQVERSKMLEMKISLEQQRTGAAAELNTLLARSADTPVGPIPDFEVKPVSATKAELLQLAEQNRPQFKTLTAQVGRGHAAQKLAKKEFFPDFTVTLEYMQREPVMEEAGDDMYSLGVTFNLPLQRGRRQAMAAEASSESTMAGAELAAVRNDADRALSALLSQLDRRLKLIGLYRDGIIPQASQSLESATISYQVNKVDFMALLDSRVTLFNYERELYESKAEYEMGRAQLEALVGKELP